jgi:hypothetical protein
MELSPPLTLQLLSAKPWTDQTRRNLVASVLMILVPGREALSAAFEGFDNGSFEVDSTLLTDLHAACPTELQVELIGTPAFRHLPSPIFKRLFLATWGNERLTMDQQASLALDLETFLRRHPTEAEGYRDIILRLLHSRRRALCVRGLYLACLLNELSPRDLERVKKKVTAAWFDHRMNALNGLCALVKRHREATPANVELATSEEVRTLARRLLRTDPDNAVRSCAYFLLRALREYEAASSPQRRRARR